MNDSIVNSFNFFWTSFTYLPTFFFSAMFTILFLHVITDKLTTYLPLLFVFSLYNFEVIDFLVINAHLSCRDTNLSSINLLLANNLNKYHPFIFYTSVLLTTPVLFKVFTMYNPFSLFSLNHFCNCTTRLTIRVLLINLFALFLGSWWALQEGTWGGWWNWDASEVLGLLVSLISLQNLHSGILFNTVMQWVNRFITTILILILSYFFIQLNFDLVSHNFGSKFFFFFNNNLFFIELLLGIGFSLASLYKNLYLSRNQLVIITSYEKKRSSDILQWLVILVLYSLMIIVLCSSFLPLLNYFIWSYFSINSFNFHIHLPFFISPVLISLLLTFFSYRLFFPSLILSVCIWAQNPGVIALLFLTSIRLSLVSITHVCILLMFSTNIASYSMNFVHWYPSMFHEEIPLSRSISYIRQSILVCDMFFIDKSITYQSSVGNWNINSWNTSYNTNSFNLNSFVLLCDSSTYCNYYSLSDGWLSPSLYIETNYLNNLLDIVILSTAIVSGFMLNKGTATLY
jgi:hypothetical protein